MLTLDAPKVSLNMPSERHDHQKALKEERAKDLKDFLDKQARENPRLRRLRASYAPIQTSITHPNQELSAGLLSNFAEPFLERTEPRKDSRFVESERHADGPKAFPPKTNRPRVEQAEQHYDYYEGSGPVNEDGYRYPGGGSWPRYNPPPWFSQMPPNMYYPPYGVYPAYPDRNHQRENYNRTYEPMPPSEVRDSEPRNAYPERRSTYNREFTESEQLPMSVTKSKVQGYAAELRKLDSPYLKRSRLRKKRLERKQRNKWYEIILISRLLLIFIPILII